MIKEIQYFNQHPRPSERWYRAHFPSRSKLDEMGAITGEASPSYCLMPHVPHEIKKLTPNAKIIMMLRDPVSRAYSAFQFNQRRGNMQITFEEWIERDFNLIGDRTADIDAFQDWLGPTASLGSTPVGLLRGVYITQIKHWHSVFPREQITVVDSSDYFADPAAFLNKTATETLGRDPHMFTYEKTHHEKRGYEKISPETKARLEAFFKPYNEALYTYLDRDFGW